MFPVFFQSSGWVSESLPPPTSPLRKCNRAGFRMNQERRSPAGAEDQSWQGLEKPKRELSQLLIMPMDRVLNTCPGNSQHACDLDKVGKLPLGLCVFSSVYPLARSPEELLLHVTQGKMWGTFCSRASWLQWLKSRLGISCLVLGWKEGRKYDPDRHLPSWMHRPSPDLALTPFQGPLYRNPALTAPRWVSLSI